MKILMCLAIFSLSFSVLCFSQSKESPSKAYVTSGGELIFSLASIEQNGNNENATLRFSPSLISRQWSTKTWVKISGCLVGWL